MHLIILIKFYLFLNKYIQIKNLKTLWKKKYKLKIQ